MADPRVLNMGQFTPTTHSTICPALEASANRLSAPFAACIIGASGVIGAGVARAYARAGCTDLILAARDVEALASVSSSILSLSHTDSDPPPPPPPRIHLRHCDIADHDSVRALAEFAASKIVPHLDAVVLVSGISGPVQLRITDGSPADGEWARVFATNTLGTYHVAHYFVPLLLASPTKAFVVVGSLAACITRGMIANTKYCVSKMAQARIVECLAQQFSEEGLLALAVHPGAVESKNALETAPKEFLQYLTDDAELCGAFCVWVTRDPRRLNWLNGRLVSAKWDPDELLAKKEDIIQGDLLKFEAKTTVDRET
ncbi:hypothetical protein ASPZODRAFT_12056 [Penicilliopsis zonata CBS 506.65]|uniref:Uncharacterized protein n=1 Tax=Penicilliopsis zonata CBS 506.65 TaxID=1073090 RepID=A0A1L9SVU5_9EURO|nr:hypothetical protein ASPZODRAFT_12056 [Penicilliopsis zonata CBS 506.65]OJJ51217.1 hypothetical protein ASPZODRAFT_12056 [Penicilliopsis zonata CBS 506.65]